MTAKDFFYKNAKATYQDCISPDECIKLMNEYNKHAAVAAWDMSKFVTTKTINNGSFGKGTSSEGLQSLLDQFK